jgi:Spy/CpxP family protein refolding chaperone
MLAMLAGCAKGREHAAPASSGSAPLLAASVPSAPPHKRMDQGPMRGGPTGVMLHAARNLNLTEVQKATVDKLQHEGTDDAPRVDLNEYQAVLIAGVRAGKIETEKLKPLRAAMDKAIEGRKEKDAEALNGLHAVLEPEQRKTLAATVRARQAERDGRMEASKPDAGKPAEQGAARRRAEQITRDLELDAAQQKKVDALIAQDKQDPEQSMEAMREEMKKGMDALLSAFEAATFDAKKLDTTATPFHRMMQDSDKHVEFLAQLLPLLKPEQREKLATRMSGKGPVGPQGGPHGPHGPHGPQRPGGHDHHGH